MESAFIYVGYFKALDNSTKAALKLFRLVKLIEIDSLANFPAEMSNSKLTNKAIWALPNLLEYLLVEFPVVVFIDVGYAIGKNTIPEVLKTIAKTGEAIVPGHDYVGRTNKMNPAVTESVFPLLAYTRSGFLEKVKPHLDCRRGVACETNIEIKRPLNKAIMKRGSVGLQKVDPRVQAKLGPVSSSKAKNGPRANPLLSDIFEFLRPEDKAAIEGSQKLRIGLGLDIDSTEPYVGFIENRFKPLTESLQAQEHGNYLITLYIADFSGNDMAVLRKKIQGAMSETMAEAGIYVKTLKAEGVDAADRVDDISRIGAIQDGCHHFYRLGPIQDLTRSLSNWLEALVRGGTIKPAPLVMITAINGNDELWLLREIVGSIHGAVSVTPMVPPPLIVVVGSNLSSGNVEMIKLWRHVEYYDLENLLFGMKLDSEVNMENFNIRLSVLEVFIDRFGSALWISSKVVIPETRILDDMRQILSRHGVLLARMPINNELPSIVVEGYDHEVFTRVHLERLNCFKGLYCRDSKLVDVPINFDSIGTIQDASKVFSLKSLLPKPSDESKRSQQYCHLSIRPEIMYNPIAFAGKFVSTWARGELDAKLVRETTKIKIAFLIPSKNKPEDMPATAHLVQHFLRSMIASVKEEEWEKFQYSLYIGYDRDDPLLDKNRVELQKAVDAVLGPLKDSVLLKYHLLPTAKCITLLWNILFIDAVKDGNDYFYQVNDDVSIETQGWTTLFVKTLQDNDGFGVVGPNDRMWQCRLLTQSFVSRKHHEIFHWYFPMEIKDWYSDNWITSVYGAEGTKCHASAMIRNGASATRYNICDQPRWKEAVVEGQKKINQWYQDQVVSKRVGVMA